MSVARVLTGKIGDGTTLLRAEGEAGRVAAVFKLMGQHGEKRGPAEAGETVAFGKLDHAKTGDTLTDGQTPHPPIAEVAPHAPVLCDRGRRQGAQGRRQARPGAREAARGGSLDHRRPQCRDA